MKIEKQKQLLKLIEKDCRLSVDEYAILLGEESTVVAHEIKRLEAENIICGYRGLIDWSKIETEWIEAFVEVRTLAQGEDGYRNIANSIKKFPQVEILYFISGGFDFFVKVRGKNIKDISRFIATNLASIPEVQGTRTHFLLDKYKEWGIDLEDNDTDHRIKVTP